MSSSLIENTIDVTESRLFACRCCGSRRLESVVDLGKSPLCETYLSRRETLMAESFYPLHAFVCRDCWLVQLDEFVSGREIFRDGYAYFSSYSDSWVAHAARYCDAMIDREGIASDARIIEVASNDGYLLQHFVKRGYRVLGIEPADNCAAAAELKGVPTRVAYLDAATGQEIANEWGQASLVAANNVLAHVPDLHGFVAGLKHLLAADGLLTVEIQHLETLIRLRQFDTIYHEHFCYFSLHVLIDLFERHDLRVVDAELLPTHGGSLRVFVRHHDARKRVQDDEGRARIDAILDSERDAGLVSLEGFRRFEREVQEAKWGLLEFLIAARRRGERVAGYGAPGKGNTLLNYCGIRTDLLEFVVDRNPYKQGRFLPGTHIPIHEPEMLRERRPDWVLILPWNLRDEIRDQLRSLVEAGTRLVVPIPEALVWQGGDWKPWKEM
ncbi:MAG: class I SAM-dependent methyltransferase [Planctomycetales bacterium]|nr:class I SAM-dependent methyltransferase [Planctomycetales bacterium]